MKTRGPWQYVIGILLNFNIYIIIYINYLRSNDQYEYKINILF